MILSCSRAQLQQQGLYSSFSSCRQFVTWQGQGAKVIREEAAERLLPYNELLVFARCSTPHWTSMWEQQLGTLQQGRSVLLVHYLALQI
jgi:hypothetical protein